MPSRGKKEAEISGQYAVNDEEKRAAFMPMRGRKDSLDGQRWFVGGAEDEKRAGFMPMRGRKNSAYPEEEPTADQMDVYPLELNDIKRSAFMPMRGRKEDFAYDQAFGGRPAYPVPQPYRQRYCLADKSSDTTNIDSFAAISIHRHMYSNRFFTRKSSAIE